MNSQKENGNNRMSSSRLWFWYIPIVFFIAILNQPVRAQYLHFVAETGPEVTSGSGLLTNAWSGAFQAPQFSEIDIDDDGDKDLFVFDRYDNSVSIFHNEGDTAYQYQPDYQDLFPELSGWVLLRDYNCDGKEDIFTANAGGIAIYENTSVGSSVEFSMVTAFLVGTSGPILVPFADMPAIVDVDGDTDLDILSFDAAGSYVIFYKNMREEGNLACNVLNFDTETICWGDFRENGTDNGIILGDSCGGQIPLNPNSQGGSRHSGSSLLAYDDDGDGDLDLVLGDILSSNLVFVRNGKNQSEAVMDFVLDSFPNVDPVSMYVYDAAYYLDVNFDGKRDLLVAPNEGAETAGNNYNNIWLYSNTGTDANPTFVKTQENFLSNSSIELGAGAIPAFLDYDSDGDLDLLVGQFAFREDPSNMFSGLTLLENTGTSSNPQFELVTTDYSGLSAHQLFNVAPTFGDLDGDGDQDMLVGDYTGKMHYFQNTAGVGNPVNFVLDSMNFGGLDVGSNATPELYDLDGDGDLDLIVGERNGNINYFQNQGDTSQAHYMIINDSVGKILLKDPLINAGYTVPRITDFDRDGKYDLVVGTYTGNVKFYSNLADQFSTKITPLENVYYNAKTNAFGDINYGRRSAPALANLHNDTLQDMIFGIYRGGLIYLKNESDPKLGVSQKISTSDITIYPNPSRGQLIIKDASFKKDQQVVIFDAVGRKVVEVPQNKAVLELDLTAFNVGVYMVIVQNNARIVHKQKIVKLD